MPLKYINATEAKPGVNIIIDDAPCTVRSLDISKSGKHGASKTRIEAVGIIDDKKRVLVKPGHEKFAVPMIEKKKGQILSIGEKTVSLMDIESFETIEIAFPEELKESLKEGMQVEYWDVEGLKMVKRTL